MKLSKPRGGFPAHVFVEHRGIGLAKIDYHKSVEHFREFSVYVKPNQLATYLGVLTEEDWKSLAVLLDIRDGLGKLLKIFEGITHALAIPTPQ